MANEFLYGAYYAQIAFRSSAGYPMGTQTAPDSVAQGTTTSAYLLRNVVSLTQPQPSREYVTDRGGTKIRAKKFVGISDYGEGELVLSERDDVFHSYVTGTSVGTTNPSGWRQTAANINIETPPAFFLILSVQSQVVNDSTNTISNKWFHHVFPNVQILPSEANASQDGGTNPNPLSYTIVPNRSFRHVTGELFSAAGFGVIANSDVYTTIETSNPIALTTYVEAAIPTGAFTLGYDPLTTQATTSDKLLTQNGVVDSFTTVSTSTGAVTTTAGSAGDIFVALYEADLDSPN